MAELSVPAIAAGLSATGRIKTIRYYASPDKTTTCMGYTNSEVTWYMHSQGVIMITSSGKSRKFMPWHMVVELDL